VCLFANNMGTMLLGRVVQGLGAAPNKYTSKHHKSKGFRPTASDTGPAINWPTAMPANTADKISCGWLALALPRSTPICPSAGSMASIDTAATDMSVAIITTNATGTGVALVCSMDKCLSLFVPCRAIN
jgi:hypothetical protein